MPLLVADLGEHQLIERIRARAGRPPDALVVGIGDDAAVWRPDRRRGVVLTTDSLVEGVHFRRDWTPADAIGHKALAVNLSDLAAMGAEPRLALLSLALPPTLPVDDVDGLIAGFLALAAAHGVALAGGNITRSPGPLVIDVTAVGAVHERRVLRRSTGRPNDELYVTGTIGGAAVGLRWKQSGLAPAPSDEAARDAMRCYERPEPRVRCGRLASRSRMTATAIDLSDGLGDAVRQIATASGVGAVVDADTIPLHEAVRADAVASPGRDAVKAALSGGEDYELLLAVSPRRRRGFLAMARQWKGVRVTRIGRLTAEPGVWLDRDGQREPLPAGFVHF